MPKKTWTIFATDAGQQQRSSAHATFPLWANNTPKKVARVMKNKAVGWDF